MISTLHCLKSYTKKNDIVRKSCDTMRRISEGCGFDCSRSENLTILSVFYFSVLTDPHHKVRIILEMVKITQPHHRLFPLIIKQNGIVQ